MAVCMSNKDPSYTGNPGGQPLYPNEIDHGYEEPIRGGTGVMRDLVKSLRHEQGRTSALRVAILAGRV